MGVGCVKAVQVSPTNARTVTASQIHNPGVGNLRSGIPGPPGIASFQLIEPIDSNTTPAMPVSIGFVTNSRGSVTRPVSALAATVSGEARYTADFVLPMRPGKLRFVVLMQTSAPLRRPNVSAGPPRH